MKDVPLLDTLIAIVYGLLVVVLSCIYFLMVTRYKKSIDIEVCRSTTETDESLLVGYREEEDT